MIAALDSLESQPNHHSSMSWVAASGKAELYVRDCLGATLAAQHPNLTVSREWLKHDLAILGDKQNPVSIIEGKHLYDFDLLVPHLRSRYRKWLLADKAKMRERRAESSYICLTMTSLRANVPKDLRRVVKYSPGSNRQFKIQGADTMNLACVAAEQLLSTMGTVVHCREFSRGEAFGIPVHLWIWIADVSQRK